MQVSARNVFAGTLTAVVCGAVNAEVELTTAGGDVLVAVVTANSVQALGLAVGVSAVAYVKAPLVMLLTGGEGMRFSARNQLAGVVSALTRGAVNSEVALTLPGGTVVYAVVTNDAIKELDLREGAPATALIKASHVVLGVPA
ncbi:TOBE domain-containing protein [Rivihabitans pingtungensis]|uniref:Molybdate transport system regulatory protein n=2 Tax=Rivihabitans pingtungensis TaxID=1054498 RepID=A0A318L4P4_9NEIS|nr:TOBE domain-containing protein [Rivihabitans pingtungensis]PXX76136.1 molybdate transport system regulatory protein [Rivihabitans pingtungensis]